jgi:hypothetical protein
MTKQKLVKTSVISAIVAALYITVVAVLMSNMDKIFAKVDSEVIGAIAVLLLFVVSAAIMGFIVLGRPIMLYLDGLKKEALKLFYLTISWLILIAIIIFATLIIS